MNGEAFHTTSSLFKSSFQRCSQKSIGRLKKFTFTEIDVDRIVRTSLQREKAASRLFVVIALWLCGAVRFSRVEFIVPTKT